MFGGLYFFYLGVRLLTIKVEQEGTRIVVTYEDFPVRFIGKGTIVRTENYRIASMSTDELRSDVLFISGSNLKKTSGKIVQSFVTSEKASFVADRIMDCVSLLYKYLGYGSEIIPL